MKVSPVAKALTNTAKNLDEAARLLSGCEPGFRDKLETAVSLEVLKLLGLDPTVGSRTRAQELMLAFRQDANRMAEVCRIARAALPNEPANRGRRPMDWYIDFTAWLVALAEKTNNKPTLSINPKTGPGGWLFRAAQALEPFAPREMRSPSPEACAKRLERSLVAIRENGQKTRKKKK